MVAEYHNQSKLRFWCQMVLPLVYDDSLSYMELLNKVVSYLNNCIQDVGNCETNRAAMPAAMVPGQSLVCSNTSISQLADKRMGTDLAEHGLVPVVVVLVFTQQTIIGAYITFQIGIIGTGRVHHDSLGRDLLPCFIAGIFSKDEFVQVHCLFLL